jgi:arylsulfatase A-like enzyme
VKVIDGHSGSSEGKKPLFLYLAYPAPHTPWLPSEEFVGTSKADVYGDFAVMVDAMIGKVLKALDDKSLRDDTLVIFTSDNGPVWYDQDVERFDHDSSGGLRGMKADAWENGHRMPFIVRWPDHVPAGTETDQTICFTDLLATFAAITDTELPPGAGPDSFNILPLLRGIQPPTKPIRGPVAMAAGNGMMMVRSGDWKLIDGLGSGGFSQPKRVIPSEGGAIGQLYNLATDLSESKNLYLDKPEIVSRLRTALGQIQKSEQTRPPVHP